jgi:hypothetical protein
MDTAHYVDLDNGEREPLFFFLLNAYLQSRIETDNESDGDEEVNVYVAGLLHSLVDGRFYCDNVDRLATSPVEVCQKAEESGSNRGKANVYRSNADHRFLAYGLFSGWAEHRSRYRCAMTSDESYMEEAQQFYSWAAVFCARLPERYRGLTATLEKLADGFDTYRHVLAHMGANHLDLLQRLSPGEAYHLERRAHEAALPKIEEHALDRMLDAYNRWRAQPSESTRAEFLQESGPYCQLRPDFTPEQLMN